LQKTSVDNYIYTEHLVLKIKDLYNIKQNYDWHFEELIRIYMPLINSSCRKVYSKLKAKATFNEIKSKIVEIFFESILRYEPSYRYGEQKPDKIENKNFTYVYFSNYLKRKLPWDLLRIYQPTRLEYDDLSGPINIELSSPMQANIKDTSIDHPVTENFIHLCQQMQKHLSDDLMADIMMLTFGYGYKNNELAYFFDISQLKAHQAIASIKTFWKINRDLMDD
jgi:hypothetical protein